MIIHHITDLHVPDEPEAAEFSHIRGCIQRQLAFIEDEQPDLLVISGDLSMADKFRG